MEQKQKSKHFVKHNNMQQYSSIHQQITGHTYYDQTDCNAVKLGTNHLFCGEPNF